LKEEINKARLKYQLAEYQVLKEEILSTLKRGFNIYFSTLALTFGVINLGIVLKDLYGSVVLLFPLFVLPSGYYLVLEQTKTIRRNAAYIHVFYENEVTGVFWETNLFKLREDKLREEERREGERREDKEKFKIKISMVTCDILKKFPTIIDVLGWVCIGLSITKFITTGN